MLLNEFLKEHRKVEELEAAPRSSKRISRDYTQQQKEIQLSEQAPSRTGAQIGR